MDYLKNDEGTAFLFVLLLIILLGALTLTLFKSAYTNLKLTDNIADKKKAYYAAEAGIAYGRYLIYINQGFPQKKPDNSVYNISDLYKIENISQYTKFKIYFENSRRYVDCIIIKVYGFYKNNTSVIRVITDKQGNLKDYRVGTVE